MSPGEQPPVEDEPGPDAFGDADLHNGAPPPPRPEPGLAQRRQVGVVHHKSRALEQGPERRPWVVRQPWRPRRHQLAAQLRYLRRRRVHARRATTRTTEHRRGTGCRCRRREPTRPTSTRPSASGSAGLAAAGRCAGTGRAACRGCQARRAGGFRSARRGRAVRLPRQRRPCAKGRSAPPVPAGSDQTG